MCGICGLAEPATAETGALLSRMLATLAHRGPDGQSTWSSPHAAFGHARLSIIDIGPTGTQPMTNETGSVAAMVNGEIYNHRDLRALLEDRGHHFNGHCDAEVLPHLYEEFGEGLFDHLRGMFAVAIFDRERRKLILGRDRYGIKPLYYARTAGGVVFGSEIKAVLAHPDVPRRINRQALHDYLSLLYVPPPATAFAAVSEVPPAHRLVFADARVSLTRYWNPPRSIRRTDGSAALDEFRHLFDRAVQSQLESDVPLGAMLSGGIDSSLVVESASRQLRGEGRALPCFTAASPDGSLDETAAAALVAQACGSDHGVLRLEAGSADVSLLDRVLRHFDQPFGDSSAIPTFLVCRAMRANVKVALGGDGGDEVFGGYARFRRAPAIRRLGRMPTPLRRAAAAALRLPTVPAGLSRQGGKALRFAEGDEGDILFGLSAYLDEAQKQELFREPLRDVHPTARLFAVDDDCAGEDAFSQFITRNLLECSLPGDMLRKVDMMSMLAGIEVRVPMLDEPLAEFGLSLPASFKTRHGQGKWLLRQVARQRLPPDISTRPKLGFNLAFDTWSGAELHAYVRSLLLEPEARCAHFLDRAVIERWVDAFVTGRLPGRVISRGGIYQRIYMLLSLEVWLRYSGAEWA